MDVDKAFEVDNGLVITNGPFYTGGASSPVGLDLPSGTLYLQDTAGGVLLWRKFGVGVNDWRQLSAQDIPFIDTDNTYKPSIVTVQDALVEVRNTIVQKPQITPTTLNGTAITTIEQPTFHIIQGTATGFTVKLPPGNTLSPGRLYEIYNDSSEAVYISDGVDDVLFTLNPEEVARLILIDNTSAKGQWIQDITSASATGITSISNGSDVTYTNTTRPPSDTVIPGMTETPPSGRYACYFSTDVSVGKNNSIGQIVFYSGGVAVDRSRRNIQGVGGDFLTSGNLLAEITVNGSQAIDVRANVTSDSIKFNQRRMILIRLGA